MTTKAKTQTFSKAVVGAKLITPPGIVSFPKISKADTQGQFADGKYKLDLLWDKKTFDKTDRKRLETACLKVAKEKWGKGITIDDITLPFRDGDDKDAEGYAGRYFITPKSKRRPGVVGPDAQPLEDGDEVYGGCIARISVVPATYENTEQVVMVGKDGKKKRKTQKVRGVTFYLNNVQKLKDGEPLTGGGTDPEEDFEEGIDPDSLDDLFPDVTGKASKDEDEDEEEVEDDEVEEEEEEEEEEAPKKRGRPKKATPPAPKNKKLKKAKPPIEEDEDDFEEEEVDEDDFE